MTRRIVRLTVLLVTGGMLALTSGCGEGWRRRDLPPEPTPEQLPIRDTVLADTVGSYTMIGAAEPMHLQGFGIVIGLGSDGGSDCPSTIRTYLIDYFAREFAARGPGEPKPRYTPEQLVDSLNTAVVAVHGMVTAGAPKGMPFDLQLQAIGTQTRSLEGGILLTTELRRFDVAASGSGLVSGRTLARAYGPVYTTPIQATGEEVLKRDPRRGFVLGGGRALVEREVRLLLTEPTVSTAKRLEGRINERFDQEPPTADAMSKGYVLLHTPAKYASDPAHFIELVSHLYLQNSPDLVERKIGVLMEQLDSRATDLHHISLVLEGMGRTVIPDLQSLYTHSDRLVRFYAARAGMRLGDVNAMAPLMQISRDPDHPNRIEAVRELGHCRYPQATRLLAELVNDHDTAVRITAYEGLRLHHHSAVDSKKFIHPLDPGQTSMTLDVVDSKGPPLIFVRRKIDPRIVVFGQLTPITLPLFYNHPDNWVTLNARDIKGEIAVLGTLPNGQLLSAPLMIPPRVVDLVTVLAGLPIKDRHGEIEGLGLGYTQTVEVLAALVASRTIPATLEYEPAPLMDLLAPAELPERPEGDEAPAEIPEMPEPADSGTPAPETSEGQ